MLAFKIILLGDVSTGKSSIISRYVTDTFDERNNSTVGTGFYAKSFPVLDEYVKLHIWDTCGEEKYRAMNQTYFHDADAAIMVYDLSNISTIHGVSYYLDQIRDTCDENIDLTIVGNKCDLVDGENDNSGNMQNILPGQDTRCYTASAKTGKNITEQFELIAESLVKNHKEKKQKDAADEDRKKFQLEKQKSVNIQPKRKQCKCQT